MATAPALNQTTNGTISQVIGAVVDVHFPGELTIVYNRQRQAAITAELIEIIAGAEAL